MLFVLLVLALGLHLHVADAVFSHSDTQSPTDAFLVQLRHNWKSVQMSSDTNQSQAPLNSNHGNKNHRYIQDAYINMVVMCTSQARQIASKDLTRLNKNDIIYINLLNDYSNCLYEISDLIMEYPNIGNTIPEIKYTSHNLNKFDIISKFNMYNVYYLIKRSSDLGQPEAQHVLSIAHST
jgi:hypothetical protein